jgi:hypothetical protein
VCLFNEEYHDEYKEKKEMKQWGNAVSRFGICHVDLVCSYDAGVADANLIFLPQPLGVSSRSVLDTMCGVDARYEFRMHQISKVPNG